MKKCKRLFIAVLTVLLLLPVSVSAAELYDYYPVPERRSIIIDGFSEERDWEDSLLIKMDMDGKIGVQRKNAIIRVLCDRSFLYLQFYVNDNDRAEYNGMPDGVLFELLDGTNSRSFFCAYDGRRMQPEPQPQDGFEYAAVNDDFYYMAEARVAFSKLWKSNGIFNLKVSVNDNFISGSRIKNSAAEKDIQIRLLLKDPSSQQNTTTRPSTTAAAVTKPPATTKTPAAAKPQKTTDAATEAAPGKTNAAGTASPTAKPDDESVFEEITFTDDSQSASGQEIQQLQGETAGDFFYAEAGLNEDNPQADRTAQFVQTIPQNGESTQATQVFGTLAAGILLFLGVCIIVRLRRGKNNGDE